MSDYLTRSAASEARMLAAREHGPDQSGPPEWAINAAQERIEDRAENEFRSNHPDFAEWVEQYVDSADFAYVLTLASKPDDEDARYELGKVVDQRMLDYKQYRVALAHRTGEWDSEMADVMEEE